ncbi:MAG TPA: penicillin-binding protein 2 [Candidatus Baltobacteraceae bacterium]|nr:penicillin-binding protein 2 [Candidatus Baltobacteraceae bacterium]
MIIDRRRTPRVSWERSPWRIAGFIVVVAIAIIALVVQLVHVQLVMGQVYRAAAMENQVRLIEVAAPRGMIYGRDGRVLVRSRPSFVVGLIPSEVTDIDSELTTLARTLGEDPAKLRYRLLHHRGVNYTDFAQVQTYEPYGPVVLASDLPVAKVARLSELLGDLPGVDLEVQPIRDYPLGATGSAVFGYVGQITESEYQRLKDDGYTPNDVIGKDGLEYVYDKYLRGVAGGQRVVVDAQGQVVPSIKLPSKAAIPGDELITNIDGRLERIAQQALDAGIKKVSYGRQLAGGVVIEDPWTGGILALASYPDFDPNAFAADDYKKVAHYLLDPADPLFDNAIGAATPTGSTFKMVTGTAALSEGVVKPNQVIYDSGAWDCYGYEIRDLLGGIGNTTFVPALAASSDGYFYQLSWRLGIARLTKWAHYFGIGSKTGIDLPGENAGNWPTNAWELKNFGVPMEPSEVCMLGIGQGAMQATPLQIANVASAVINGGTLWRPEIVHEIRTPDGKHIIKTIEPQVLRHVPGTPQAFYYERAGMAKVTDPGGTAYGWKIKGLPFSGKTGTAETGVNGSGANTTWFVAWAPTDHPVLAMAVFVWHSGGYGATVAAPIAREILVKYFHKSAAIIQ